MRFSKIDPHVAPQLAIATFCHQGDVLTGSRMSNKSAWLQDTEDDIESAASSVQGSCVPRIRACVETKSPTTLAEEAAAKLAALNQRYDKRRLVRRLVGCECLLGLLAWHSSSTQLCTGASRTYKALDHAV